MNRLPVCILLQTRNNDVENSVIAKMHGIFSKHQREFSSFHGSGREILFPGKQRFASFKVINKFWPVFHKSLI